MRLADTFEKNRGAIAYFINNFKSNARPEMIETILSKIEGMNKADFAASLKSADARNQFLVLAAVVSLAVNRAAGEDDDVSVAGVAEVARLLIRRQSDRVARYGAEAFPLSDGQIDVVVRDVWNWVELEGKISRKRI